MARLRLGLGWGARTNYNLVLSSQAANPGCILDDFVRWYSPRDWIEEDDMSPPHPDSATPSGGVATIPTEDEEERRHATPPGGVVSSDKERLKPKEQGESREGEVVSSHLAVEEKEGEEGEEGGWGGGEGWDEEGWDVLVGESEEVGSTSPTAVGGAPAKRVSVV